MGARTFGTGRLDLRMSQTCGLASSRQNFLVDTRVRKAFKLLSFSLQALDIAAIKRTEGWQSLQDCAEALKTEPAGWQSKYTVTATMYWGRIVEKNMGAADADCAAITATECKASNSPHFLLGAFHASNALCTAQLWHALPRSETLCL